MKELSIEQKAKIYDEALERAKGVIEQNPLMEYLKKGIEYIFPELKENKDEMMRKELIKTFKSLHQVKLWNGIERTKILAWLEKQGNLMKALQISNARIGELIEENYYLREQLEKQGENNMGISEATKQELEDTLNKALEKETPESFNEFLDEQKSDDTEKGAKGNDREIPNSAWSEEDENIIEWLIGYLEYQIMNATITEEKDNCLDAIDLLKSLKYRCAWKPSDEQLETFEYYLDADISNKDRKVLFRLYEQLKKL